MKLCEEFKVVKEDVLEYESLLMERIQSVDEMIHHQFERMKGIVREQKKMIRDKKIEQAESNKDLGERAKETTKKKAEELYLREIDFEGYGLHDKLKVLIEYETLLIKDTLVNQK